MHYSPHPGRSDSSSQNYLRAPVSCRRYTHTELLAGDNAYSCEKCKKDVEAERRLCFEVAPNTLQICLKRFVSVRHLRALW